MSSGFARDLTRAMFPSSDSALPRCRMFAPQGTNQARPAVVIVPGGSYHHHPAHEGEVIAQRLVAAGLVAFVLEYSLGPVPLASHLIAEPGRVIAYVRTHAEALGVARTQVHLLGFSAGGHLAGLSTCHSLESRQSDALPNTIGLIYPVVSCAHDAHPRCLAAWLGERPTSQALAHASLDQRLDASFPATFVVSAADDLKVLPSHTLALTQACLAHRVPIEVHLLATGGHGFGLGGAGAWDWCARFVLWLRDAAQKTKAHVVDPGCA